MAGPLAIFDMDGTIVDSMFYWNRAPSCVLREMGIVLDDEADRQLSQRSFYHLPAFLVDYFSLPCRPDELACAIDSWVLERYRRDVLLIPSVQDYLRSLQKKQVTCILLTASKEPFIEAMLERHHLNGCFSATFSTNALQMEKSDPAVFRFLFDRFQCKPQDCTLFDDSAYAVRTASNLGIRTVGILDPWFPAHHEELKRICNRTIQRYSELLRDDVF